MTIIEPRSRSVDVPGFGPEYAPMAALAMTGRPVVSTLGVEEEFLLVDRLTRAPVARAGPVIDAASPVLGDLVQEEFYRCMVEVCTRPATSAADVRAQLRSLRAAVADAARAADCLLVASGTAVVPPAAPVPVTDTPRYRRMARRFDALVDGRLGVVCGCHIHIGTADRAQALFLANHVRAWLPAVQALAVNSPFAGGLDTGFASWRALEFGRWPTVAPSPLLDPVSYERTAEALVASGTLMDRRMIYWFARPSEHQPTIEFRVADTNADLDTTLLVALVLRGLCATLLAHAEEGRPPPDISVACLREAHRYAARYGPAGYALDPFTGEHVPAQAQIAALLRAASPGLRAAGDEPEVHRLLDALRRKGSGAARQRAALRRANRLRDVVDDLAELTTGS
ncbi:MULTISPECIES: carboxylate-amine ligase [Streptomyces]|uniref:Putative glutamate--cysteine ligase 2 n=1 Tax=Streptomyces spororaveus TaxID=284039 RepID=A0ABQ3TQ21_9ACTN|nr:glutamate--cysteine ligase [Streptomyces spororaveus]GHI82505.1 putative glutamate--cysteine ligase 2 [Streptomyces spororaveus]